GDRHEGPIGPLVHPVHRTGAVFALEVRSLSSGRGHDEVSADKLGKTIASAVDCVRRGFRVDPSARQTRVAAGSPSRSQWEPARSRSAHEPASSPEPRLRQVPAVVPCATPYRGGGTVALGNGVVPSALEWHSHGTGTQPLLGGDPFAPDRAVLARASVRTCRAQRGTNQHCDVLVQR